MSDKIYFTTLPKFLTQFNFQIFKNGINSDLDNISFESSPKTKQKLEELAQISSTAQVVFSRKGYTSQSTVDRVFIYNSVEGKFKYVETLEHFTTKSKIPFSKEKDVFLVIYTPFNQNQSKTEKSRVSFDSLKDFAESSVKTSNSDLKSFANIPNYLKKCNLDYSLGVKAEIAKQNKIDGPFFKDLIGVGFDCSVQDFFLICNSSDTGKIVPKYSVIPKKGSNNYLISQISESTTAPIAGIYHKLQQLNFDI